MGYRGGPQQFGQQFGRPQINPAAAPAYRGGPQIGAQPARPMAGPGANRGAGPAAMQAGRGGAQQFGQPQMFHSPAPSYRGAAVQSPGRIAPQTAAKPAPAPAHSSGGSAARHK